MATPPGARHTAGHTRRAAGRARRGPGASLLAPACRGGGCAPTHPARRPAGGPGHTVTGHSVLFSLDLELSQLRSGAWQ
eukprot:385084-Hanusia_phi.AAC.1